LRSKEKMGLRQILPWQIKRMFILSFICLKSSENLLNTRFFWPHSHLRPMAVFLPLFLRISALFLANGVGIDIV